ncbi:MAG: hypothetical protein WD712_03310 [Candidatus Spechtbacterales bacterium]
MNRKTITISVLFVFLSITFFGFFIVGNMEHDMHMPCPFYISNSPDCPDTGMFGLVFHHVNSVKAFSQAVITIGVLSALAGLAYFFDRFLYRCFRAGTEQKISIINITTKNYNKLNEQAFAPLLDFLNQIRNARNSDADGLTYEAHGFLPV